MQNAPAYMGESLINMTDNNRSQYILSAMECRYNPEWDALYLAISRSIYMMYKVRSEMDQCNATSD